MLRREFAAVDLNPTLRSINEKSPKKGLLILLRREGSNLRPSGYEPDELPLLYLAI